ncbi:MAG: putative rane protein [Herbinix sp.]|jgi:membrane protease YdiL (CAAX protease family)|nr:putative rane protein [Herbinix sp.]
MEMGIVKKDKQVPIFIFIISQQKEEHKLNEIDNNSDIMQTEISPKKIISHAGLSLFIMATVIIFFNEIKEVLVQRFVPEIAKTDWYIWVSTLVGIVLIGFPIFVHFINRIPDSPKGEIVKLKPKTFIAIFFICTAAMYISNYFSVIITFIISMLKGEQLANPVMEAITGSNFYFTLIYVAGIAPIVEEFIFRGFLLSKLRRFGDIPAIVLTGVAFGLFHFNISQFFYATVLGFIFAYITIRTNTLRYSILLHMMINFIGSAVAPLVLKGELLAAGLMAIWVLGAIVAGSVLFILNIRKIKLDTTEPIMKRSDYLLNTGVLLYIGFCLVMIAFRIIL